MTTAITHFGLTETEIIRKDNNFYLPISKLAEVLGTSKNTIQQNIIRNKEEFGLITIDKLSTVTGAKDGYLLNQDQIILLCMLMRTEKAKGYRKLFVKIFDSIRKKEYIHISEVQGYINRGNILAGIPKQKLIFYKKYRGLGLSRKHCCKAFELPYSKMKEIDKVLGFYKERDNSHLIPFQYIKGGHRLMGMQNNLFGDPASLNNSFAETSGANYE